MQSKLPHIYKRLLIAAGGLVALVLLATLVYKTVEYDNLHPQKYICVKSHSETEYVYGYGMGFDGKMTTGFHWETRSVCDVHGINPRWKELNGQA